MFLLVVIFYDYWRRYLIYTLINNNKSYEISLIGELHKYSERVEEYVLSLIDFDNQSQ